jgi:hypothetical protein
MHSRVVCTKFCLLPFDSAALRCASWTPCTVHPVVRWYGLLQLCISLHTGFDSSSLYKLLKHNGHKGVTIASKSARRPWCHTRILCTLHALLPTAVAAMPYSNMMFTSDSHLLWRSAAAAAICS